MYVVRIITRVPVRRTRSIILTFSHFSFQLFRQVFSLVLSYTLLPFPTALEIFIFASGNVRPSSKTNIFQRTFPRGITRVRILPWRTIFVSFPVYFNSIFRLCRFSLSSRPSNPRSPPFLLTPSSYPVERAPFSHGRSVDVHIYLSGE